MPEVPGTPGGRWDQTKGEVLVEIPVGSAVDREAVSVDFSATHLCVRVSSAVVLETALFAEVESDGCSWELSTAEDGTRLLAIKLAKKKKQVPRPKSLHMSHALMLCHVP